MHTPSDRVTWYKEHMLSIKSMQGGHLRAVGGSLSQNRIGVLDVGEDRKVNTVLTCVAKNNEDLELN